MKVALQSGGIHPALRWSLLGISIVIGMIVVVTHYLYWHYLAPKSIIARQYFTVFVHLLALPYLATIFSTAQRSSTRLEGWLILAVICLAVIQIAFLLVELINEWHTIDDPLSKLNRLGQGYHPLLSEAVVAAVLAYFAQLAVAIALLQRSLVANTEPNSRGTGIRV